MRSLDDCIPSSRNAFSPSFLARVNQRDEPPTAGEADVAGPWHVEEIPGRGHGLFRAGESRERGFAPYAVFHGRWLALLAAAVLPGTGRDAAFRLAKESGREGFAVESARGVVVGHCGLFDESLIFALHMAEGLARSPEGMADLLEAAGPVCLERAGAILDERVAGLES
ncbi:MAG TPA: hypothetical protein VIE43_05390 [Thermoanaerobaculia bacterium]|nr:hypothetical protein [Thermoanaerobaculia bacterium]